MYYTTTTDKALMPTHKVELQKRELGRELSVVNPLGRAITDAYTWN